MTETLRAIIEQELTKAKQDGRIAISDFFRKLEEGFKAAGFRDELSGVPSVLITRLDVVGDHIVTTGFIREVRRNFPTARITLVVSPSVKQLAEFCPYVNDVLAFDGEYMHGPVVDMFFRVYEFCAETLWSRHFTYAFCPQWGSENLSSLFLMFMSGAQKRFGFGQYPGEAWLGKKNDNLSEFDRRLLTQKIVTPQSVVSEAEKYFYLLKTLGYSVIDTSMELWYSNADALKAKVLLAEGNAVGTKIVLGLGAGSENRKYPIDKWLVALREIARDEVTFVILGGKKEESDAALVEKELPQGKVLNLVGRTTMRETAAVVAACDMYVGNDTGVMHMAAAAHKRVLVIYREAKTRENFMPGLLSEYARFPAWQTPYIALRPKEQLDECAAPHMSYGGCLRLTTHCIAAILPQEIVAAYKTLTESLLFYRGNV